MGGGAPWMGLPRPPRPFISAEARVQPEENKRTAAQGAPRRALCGGAARRPGAPALAPRQVGRGGGWRGHGSPAARVPLRPPRTRCRRLGRGTPAPSPGRSFVSPGRGNSLELSKRRRIFVVRGRPLFRDSGAITPNHIIPEKLA
ncbi:small ubiquitin-related modifier 1 isoform X1 [Macrotis lagotis]|uniref:small ubiquitin-related modifier 1 isoform X1 n=1 Tax=Macrotis lagotis TaxID=92651 RepID=UPI003D682ABB